MESLLHIIACGLVDLFRHTPNDEKKAVSKIYLVFRELCNWSRYSMDYWLPPLRAKHVFVIMVEHKKHNGDIIRYETTPDGRKNGHYTRIKANGAVRTAFYLRNTCLWYQKWYQPGWYIGLKGSSGPIYKQRIRRDPYHDVLYMYVMENASYRSYIRKGNLSIMWNRDKIVVIMMIHNLFIAETQHASGYELEVTTLSKAFRVFFYYKKSYIYAVPEDIWLLAKLISIGNLPHRIEEIVGEIRSAMGWRARKY